MKHIICLLCFLPLLSGSFSQTIESAPNIKQTTKSSWGLKLEVGGLLHQMPNQDIVDVRVTLAGSITLFYKQLFIRNEIYTIGFSPKNNMVIGEYLFFKNAEFISINMNPEIGYCFNFNNKWSSDIRLGANITNFDLRYTEEYGSFHSDYIAGLIAGVTIDRYIEFHDFKYLVLGLNIDYYSTNYHTLSPQLNKTALNFSLTVAYKCWFKKSKD
jgi:hypothetical protein